MKKRWMAVISAVALSMTMLAGCAGTPGSKQQPEREHSTIGCKHAGL